MTCLVPPSGERTQEKTLPNTPQGRAQLVGETDEGTHVVLEVGTYGKPVARAFTRAGFKVVLAEAREVRRRAGSDQKSDANDAFELAHQYRLGVIKQAYLPSEAEEELRCLVRHRIDLAHKGTLVKNQIHAQLGRAGALPPLKDESLFTRHGLRYLAHVPVPSMERNVLDFHLRELELVGKEIQDVDGQLADVAKDDTRAQRLMTIRGVDYYAALVIVTEIGDVTRFPTAKKLASYAGLVPREHQSGQTHYRGHITKAGPANLRWILTACTHNIIKSEGKFKRIYRRVSRRSGKNRAKIAVAHKLLTVVWAMWTRGEDFEDKEDDLTYRKLAKMRRVARPLVGRDPALVVKRIEEKALEKVLTIGGE